MRENGDIIGESPTMVHIFLGENESYQECSPETADGFCAKLPVETEVGTELVDTVFQLPNHILRGDEPIANYE